MPEGDTIFRAARTLRRALEGKTVTRFETALAQLASVDDQSPIRGRVVQAVTSAGKNLLMQFSGDLTLRTHMRMNGSWHIYRPGERWVRPRSDMRIVIETGDFVAVAFNVPVAEFLDERQRVRHADLGGMGPDLLQERFDRDEALRRIRARPDAEIALTLLNQRVLAGIGNVFKSEALFVAGVNPFATIGSLSEEVTGRIVDVARRQLLANVTDGHGDGIVTYTGMRRTTGRSDPADRLWVYGRKGEPCRKCGTPIEYRKHGPDARSTYWCPRCQPA